MCLKSSSIVELAESLHKCTYLELRVVLPVKQLYEARQNSTFNNLLNWGIPV